MVLMTEDVNVLSLDAFYFQVKRELLYYQHPITGLFPIDPDNPKCNLANVRDSIYCATALWALSQAYRKVDDDKGRTYELRQSAVKCLRTILCAWMNQCDRLEAFKLNQVPENSLYSVLSLDCGDEPIFSRSERQNDYPHLQLDVVALFVIQTVQMISAAAEIIFTKTEVLFVQNLCFYLERAYRIPDFGMWERGSKPNIGHTELHASSVGFAKAALEALHGCNFFGIDAGDHSTTVVADIDAHSRNRIILESLLPRQSASKGADSALIPTLGWPAFASHENSAMLAFDRVRQRFEGPCGFKRHSRDGYGSWFERSFTAYYELGELKNFEGMEPEWPLFLAYLVITLMIRGQKEAAQSTYDKLQSLLIDLEGVQVVSDDSTEVNSSVIMSRWMPRYYVPLPLDVNLKDSVKKSRERSKSLTVELRGDEDLSAAQYVSSFSRGQPKFLWGQSVLIIAQLLVNGLLKPHELDPIRRHLPPSQRPVPSRRCSPFESKPQDLVVQVVLVAESVRLQQMLATFGVQAQTPLSVEPVDIWPPSSLTRVSSRLGSSEALGLSGRPQRPVGQLGTSKFYRIRGFTVISYPLLFEWKDFYLNFDINMVVDEVKAGLQFLSAWWRMRGRPTCCILLREDLMQHPKVRDFIDFLASLRSGRVGSVRVRLGRAQNFISTGCLDHLDYLQDQPDLVRQCRASRLFELQIQRSFQGALATELRLHGCLAMSGRSNQPPQEVVSRYFEGESFNAIERMNTSDIVAALIAGRDKLANGERAQLLGQLRLRESGAFLLPPQVVVSGEDSATTPVSTISTSKSNSIYKRRLSNYSTEEDQNAAASQVAAEEQVDLTVDGQMLALCRSAGLQQQWNVVRYCAALLRRVVDSLAPSLAAILVNGKILTVGVQGHEVQIKVPLSPKEITAAIFDVTLPFDVAQAVLQQEFVIYVGGLIISDVDLFRGMTVIRLCWLSEALQNELHFSASGAESVHLYGLSPFRVKQLLKQVLCREAHSQRHPLWARRIDGCLFRVPEHFYERVYFVLERCPEGFCFNGKCVLHQQPALSNMTRTDMNFVFLFEQSVEWIREPAYRQLVVETFCIMYSVLKRNPELQFEQRVDINALIEEAFEDFKRERLQVQKQHPQQQSNQTELSSSAGAESGGVVHNGSSFPLATRSSDDEMHLPDELRLAFFQTPSIVKRGTATYLARAVVNLLLTADLDMRRNRVQFRRTEGGSTAELYEVEKCVVS